MIYISYNSDDLTAVQYFVQKLKQQGMDVWLDVEMLLAGDALTDKIERGLRLSSSVILCLGSSGLGHWQKDEISVSRELSQERASFRVIPVLLPGADLKAVPVMIRATVLIDFRETLEDTFEWHRLKSALSGSEIQDALPKTRSAIAASPENKKAVSVALIHDSKILLLRRASSQKSGGGLWQLPGGKVQDHEDTIQSAIRETEEEVGIVLDKANLHHITDLVDTWVVGGAPGIITMSVYYAPLDSKNTLIPEEFDASSWSDLSEIFRDNDRIFFGSTARFLRVIRRFFYVHQPLKQIASHLATGKSSLPQKLDCLSVEASQSIYALLSLLGFLDDKNDFDASSTLSSNIIKLLSEWALTESAIFEAHGSKAWYQEVERKGDLEEVEKYRAGLFEQHKNILGLLAHRLPKALSTRSVCDILILGATPNNGKRYLLLRWDFLANKFQIPSKGLEEFGSHINSPEAAEFVVGERIDASLRKSFTYKYIGRTKTSHVGAGSLGDGPILRNFIVSVFSLAIAEECQIQVSQALNSVNAEDT